MKTLFTLLLSLFTLSAFAQVAEPALLWLKGYGGNGDDQVGTAITNTPDGGFIITIGSTSTTGTGNIDSLCIMNGDRSVFLKYNADASIIEWSLCSQEGSYIFPQSDGGFIYGGITTAVPSGWAYKILKEDASGATIWRKTYGGQAASAILRAMIKTMDGGYIMAGTTNYTDTDFATHYGSWMTDDIGVIKVDSNGNKVWSTVIGGSEEDDVFSIVPAQDGGCFIVGKTQSSDYDCTGYHGGGDDAYVARLDSNGNLLWHRDLGGSGADGAWGWGIADNKGGVLIATRTNSGDGDVHHYIGGFDYWVLEIDSSNNILWDNCYGGPLGDESAMAVCYATDGSIWINGVSGTPSGEVDTIYGLSGAWVVHADSAGNFLSGKVLGGEGTNWGQMICPLTGGLAMAGGYYTSAGGLFSSLDSFGNTDAFLCVLAPWLESVQQIQMINNIVKIYPNPATNEVNISLTAPLNDNYTISVSDLVGKQIYAGTIQKNNITINIDTRGWTKGVYIVQVISENGLKTVNKLLVE